MSYQEFRHISLEEREKISREAALTEFRHKKNKKPIKSFFGFSGKLLLIIFALIGIGFSSIYAAVNLHLTNTEGIVDKQADDFWQSGETASAVTEITTQNNTDIFFNGNNYCRMKQLKGEYPGTFSRILNLAQNNEKGLAQENLNAAMDNLNLTADSITNCNEMFNTDISSNDFSQLAGTIDNQELFIFATSSEWAFFKNAVLKDQDVIKKVEEETGIKSRVLVAELVAEQMRLFFSDRGWFEKMISPAKVLTSMTQFSWGVLGIKEDTAAMIENNLKSTLSPFYLGSQYENILDFSATTTNISQARFERITDHQNHYYAYLYAALFDKEIITQWLGKGFDISNRPEILATIYNIGFAHSEPKSNPQMGGAAIDVAGNKYSFGRVAYDFYYSGELLDEFPQ